MIKMHRKSVTAVIALFFSLNILSVSANDDPLNGLDSYVQERMARWKTPGLAVAVVKDNKVVLAKGFGTRTVGKNQPVNKDTLFAIGSNSKYFTANALAILVGEGKISWDDLMIDRLPGFQVENDFATSHTTIRDALSHRTGTQRGDASWIARPSLSRKNLLGLMKHLKAEQDFRSGYLYNNFMILATGEIIPEVTGMSWDKFVAQKFFKPLGMVNTNTSVTQFGSNPNVATPHVMKDDSEVAVPYHNIDNMGPAGSINSSVSDMAQWLKLQLNDGKWGDKQIVPLEALGETRRLLASKDNPQNDESAELTGIGKNFSGYGMAIGIGDSAGYKVFHHGGGIDGMISKTAFVPELGLGVVVLTNMSNSMSAYLTSWIIDRYTGAENIDRINIALEQTEEKKKEAADKLHDMKQNAVTGAGPSRPLDNYAGRYSNDLMGELEIKVNDDGFDFFYGEGMKGHFTHLHFDTFLSQTTAPVALANDGDVPVVFGMEVDGSINTLTMDGVVYIKN